MSSDPAQPEPLQPQPTQPVQPAPDDDRTTVLLADDHLLLGVGVTALLEAAGDLVVVGHAVDGAQAVEMARRLRPHVILMDLSMPTMDGVEATRLIHANLLDTRILVLTSFSDSARVRDALEAGAIGYLLKDCDPADLVASVRAAARGHSPLDPRVAGTLLPTRPAPVQLSRREREVLALVCEGMSNKQIARRLGIAEHTVKIHLGNAFRRIGVSDRTSAALWVREHLGTDTP
jgi:DNA-binding NarL/FixJ family response regulator